MTGTTLAVKRLATERGTWVESACGPAPVVVDRAMNVPLVRHCSLSVISIIQGQKKELRDGPLLASRNIGSFAPFAR
jgi:hypothetical protein